MVKLQPSKLLLWVRFPPLAYKFISVGMDIPRLHPDTIEEVKTKVDILDVVGEHVVLKKRGERLSGFLSISSREISQFFS